MKFIECFLWALLIGCGSLAEAAAQPVQMGAGSFLLADKGGDHAVPAAPHRNDTLLKRAAQGNHWYSTLICSTTPEANFVQALLVKPTSPGLEVALSPKEVVPTERKDTEIH